MGVVSTPGSELKRGRAAADQEVLGTKHTKLAAPGGAGAGRGGPRASAVGGPHEAGMPGHFQPISGPSDGEADHPQVPGPH
jgi:hypothetical protein